MVLKLVGFCCSIETGWLIGDRVDVGVVQVWRIIFAEISVEEVLEGAKVRQHTISCGLMFSLFDTFFDHRFKFSNVDVSGNNDHCRVLPHSTAMSGFSDRPRSDFHVLCFVDDFCERLC